MSQGAQHWARVQLAAGHSGAAVWDLSSEVPEARIVVGASPGAGWQVQGEGIAPEHFELFWDGQSLWVSAPRGGDLRVDGASVTDWLQLAGTARVEFGAGAMAIESSYRPQAPPAAPMAPAHDDFSDFASGDEGATAMWRPSHPEDPSKPEEFEVGSTRLLMNPHYESDRATHAGDQAPAVAAPSAGKPSFGKPSFGGAGAPAAPAAAPESPLTLKASRASMSFVNAEPGHTAILDTENDPALAAAIAAGRAAEAGEASVQVAPMSQRNVATDVYTPDTQQPTGRFAPPPPNAGASDGKFRLPVPPRTLILLGVTLVVAILGLVLVSMQKSKREAEARASEMAAQQQAAAQAAAQAATAARERQSARAAREQAREQAALAAEPPPEPIPTTDEDGDPLDEEALAELRAAAALRRAQKVKAAADLVAANDHRQALDHYLRLARDYPDDASFRAMAVILAEKLRARCREGSRPGGEPCD